MLTECNFVLVLNAAWPPAAPLITVVFNQSDASTLIVLVAPSATGGIPLTSLNYSYQAAATQALLDSISTPWNPVTSTDMSITDAGTLTGTTGSYRVNTPSPLFYRFRAVASNALSRGPYAVAASFQAGTV